MWKANAKTHFMFTDNLSYCLRLRFASKTHRSRCVAISHRFDHEDRTSHKTDNKQKSKSLTRVFTIASKSLRKRKTFHHRDLKEFSAFKFETKKNFLNFPRDWMCWKLFTFTNHLWGFLGNAILPLSLVHIIFCLFFFAFCFSSFFVRLEKKLLERTHKWHMKKRENIEG